MRPRMQLCTTRTPRFPDLIRQWHVVDHVVDGRACVADRNSYRARVARHTSPGLQPATVRTGPSI